MSCLPARIVKGAKVTMQITKPTEQTSKKRFPISLPPLKKKIRLGTLYLSKATTQPFVPEVSQQTSSDLFLSCLQQDLWVLFRGVQFSCFYLGCNSPNSPRILGIVAYKLNQHNRRFNQLPAQLPPSRRSLALFLYGIVLHHQLLLL